MSLNKEELAYSAGFFDGEGCIGVGGIKTIAKSVTARVYNAHKEPLEFFKGAFGGKIHHKKRSLQNAHWSDMYEWVLCGRNSEEFLQKILPYLRIKHAEVEIALKLIDTFKPKWKTGYYRLSEEGLKRRAQLTEEMREVKAQICRR